jgi:hypothetical protein
MVRPKVSTEPVVRNAVAVVAATLLPSAVVCLPGALLDTLLCLCAPWLLIAPLLLGALRLLILVRPLLLLGVLWLLILVRPLLLLGACCGCYC